MTYDETLDTLPRVWELFTSAIFAGAVEADHPSGKGQDDVTEWAERQAEDAIERYGEEIDEEEDINPPDKSALHQAERLFREVLLTAWHEVREDYNSKRESLRDLDVIAYAVAERLGIELPNEFTMGTLNVDRFNVIR